MYPNSYEEQRYREQMDDEWNRREKFYKSPEYYDKLAELTDKKIDTEKDT